jgi:hypothetical protein
LYWKSASGISAAAFRMFGFSRLYDVCTSAAGPDGPAGGAIFIAGACATQAPAVTKIVAIKITFRFNTHRLSSSLQVYRLNPTFVFTQSKQVL